MNHATPKMRHFANRLIAHEAKGNCLHQTENRTASEVVQKLRPQLVELMGDTGFRAVLNRSLALATDEVPWLDGARINEDGRLDGFDAPVAPAGIPSGGEVMLAWLLGLLGSFLGEILTMRLVLEVWPHLSLKGYFLKGIENEETS